MHVPLNRAVWASLALALAGLVQYLRHCARKRSVTAIMADRPALDDGAFARLFPKPQGAIAVKVRSELAAVLATSLPGLLPADLLGADLGLTEQGREALLRFVGAIEEAFDIDLPHSSRCSAMSVGDLVAYVWDKTRRTGGSDRRKG